VRRLIDALRMAPAFEAKGAAAHRGEMLAGASGRVIEVGAGTGLNCAPRRRAPRAATVNVYEFSAGR
jgi:hypothetical protein